MQGLKNPLARHPGLVISTFGLAEIISCMPDGLVKKLIGSWQIFAYLLIFIYVICCLISSNVLFIQPLAFCRNWEQRRKKNCITRHKTQLQQMTAHRKFWKWNTRIGFRNRERLFPILPIVKKKLLSTVNTHIFFGLTVTWTVESMWK